MTIKEEIQTIINQRNMLDNAELEKQLGFLVWEVKRVIFNEIRILSTKQVNSLDEFLVKLDEAVK